MTLLARPRALWEAGLRWYRTHSPRDQRIILGVLVAVALSLVYVAVVEPVLDYRKTLEQEIAEGQDELERSMRFLAAKDTLRAERDELRKRLTQAKARLLPGGTGTLGAAALQERANALASEKGIIVQSTQVMKEEAADPFRKVSIRLTLSSELKPLAELVSGLEYGQQLGIPFLEVSRRGAVAAAKGPRTLAVTVEVSGFVQGGGKAEGGGDADAGAPAADAGQEQAASTDGQATASTTTLLPPDAGASTSTSAPAPSVATTSVPASPSTSTTAAPGPTSPPTTVAPAPVVAPRPPLPPAVAPEALPPPQAEVMPPPAAEMAPHAPAAAEPVPGQPIPSDPDAEDEE